MGWFSGVTRFVRGRARLEFQWILVTVAVTAGAGCGRLGYEELLVTASDDASVGPDSGLAPGDPMADGRVDAASVIVDRDSGTDSSSIDPGSDAGTVAERDSATGGSTCTASAATTLSTGPGVNWPAIAWDGAAYGIAWSATVGVQTEVFFMRVSPTGTVLTTARQVSGAAGDSAFRPDIAWDGSSFALVWEGDDEVYVATITPDGVLSSSEARVSFSPGFESSRTAIAWTGSAFAMVWKDDRHGPFEIYFATATPAGVPGAEVRLTNTPNRSQQPAIAVVSDRMLLAFQENVATEQHIFGQLIDFDGATLASAVQLTDATTIGTLPTVAATGPSLLAAWGLDGSGIGGVAVDGVSGSATGSVSALANDGESGVAPVLVPFRTGFAAFWLDLANDAIAFRLVGGDGNPQGAAAVTHMEPTGLGLLDGAYNASDGVGLTWIASAAGSLRFMHACP